MGELELTYILSRDVWEVRGEIPAEDLEDKAVKPACPCCHCDPAYNLNP
ncbi:hypothetical protein AB0383_49760 [Amycolatopsis sp. NPDC051373]